jgi:hypothetical protein
VVVAHIVAVGGGGFFVLDFGVEEDVDCRCASGKGKRRRKTPGHFHGVVMILSSSGLFSGGGGGLVGWVAADSTHQYNNLFTHALS